MEKLDRLGWADGMAFIAYGIRIGVRVSERGHLARLERILPPYWKPTRSPRVDIMYSLRVGGKSADSRVRHFHLLYADSARIVRSMDVEEVFRSLELHLNFFVSLEARNRLFVHAGVVAWKDRAILIPGRSFSGKTTLVDALVRAGATYYSDEFAVLDARGRVHPYPTPLALRERRSSRARRRRRRPASAASLRPLRIGLVVVSRFQDGSLWSPRWLSPSRAVLALLAHTVPARTRPGLALTILKKAVAAAPAAKGLRGEAEETAKWILARLDNLDRRAA